MVLSKVGLAIGILITGTMFALAHLDFTPVLWPYYLAVATLYGVTTFLADSIWPAIVLHTAGNIYSNVDLLLHGQAEWQASGVASSLIWSSGVDGSFVRLSVAVMATAALACWAYARLAAETRRIAIT